ncbi:(S)-2-haloacid dehalogenase 4A [Rhodospirillaceae bacterium LM-1]|nr:(S)-2-haloacid dehalogenase 4A [Rhodospirillaceae bacterium LM-1]
MQRPKIVVFDAYGTLFDVAAAVRRLSSKLDGQDKALAGLWRQKQLEYTWLRSLRGDFVDFEQVTGEALDWSLSSQGLDVAALHAPLMALYRQLDAYPDAKETLERLKSAGMRTAILSNGSQSMLDAAIASAGIGAVLDDVLSVDRLRIYKPHPSVYAMVEDRCQAKPSETVFVSGNFWDASAGAAFGFHAIWINRANALPEPLPGRPKATIGQLADLNALLKL